MRRLDEAYFDMRWGDPWTIVGGTLFLSLFVLAAWRVGHQCRLSRH
jgi:hypothetical protein